MLSADHETSNETTSAAVPSEVSPTTPDASTGQRAQEVMWTYLETEQAQRRTPTGTDLDRVAGTNNYGRRVLRQWRSEGRIPPARSNGRMVLAASGEGERP